MGIASSTPITPEATNPTMIEVDDDDRSRRGRRLNQDGAEDADTEGGDGVRRRREQPFLRVFPEESDASFERRNADQEDVDQAEDDGKAQRRPLQIFHSRSVTDTSTRA